MSWERIGVGRLGTRWSRLTGILGFSLMLWISACSQAADENKAIIQRPGAAASPVSSEVGVGDLYAVVVGVSNYANPKIPKLKVSDKDAKDFAAFLKTQAKLFKNTHLTLLLNEKATKRELETQLVYELRKAGKDDTVVVFLSGHGANDPRTPGEFFFLTHDSDPEVLAVTAVHMNRTWFVEKLESKRFVLIADACHGSGVIDRKAKAAAPSFQAIAQQFKESEGRVFITSSRADQYSKEMPERGNSLFTHFLLEGLGGKADENGDGIVTLKELYDYVYARTKDASRGEQHPQWEARGMTGTFPMALYTPLPNAPVAVRTPVAALEPSPGTASPKPPSARPARPAASPQELFQELAQAIIKGDVKQVQDALDRGADINALDEVKSLQRRPKGMEWTPLQLACRYGEYDIAKILLNRGAQVNAHKGRAILTAARWGHVNIVELLLEKKAKLSEEVMGAACAGGHVNVVRFLLGKGLSVNSKPGYGKTPLMTASENGDITFARFLLEKGASVHTENDSGETAWTIAIKNGQREVADLLETKGAGREREVGRLLINASQGGQVDFVRQLLQKNVNVNVSNELGTTPLMAASEQGHAHVVSLLLERGANTRAKDKDGETALEL